MWLLLALLSVPHPPHKPSAPRFKATPSSLRHAKDLCAKYGAGIPQMKVALTDLRGRTVYVPCSAI